MSQTTPLNVYQRTAHYLDQTGRGQLTARQARRADKKLNLADKRERIAKELADA